MLIQCTNSYSNVSDFSYTVNSIFTTYLKTGADNVVYDYYDGQRTMMCITQLNNKKHYLHRICTWQISHKMHTRTQRTTYKWYND